MLIDSRSLPRSDDGLPVIQDRDRVPLLALIQGAVLTASFTQRERAVPQYRENYPQRFALKLERDAVAYELTLPKEWHYAPVRAYRDGKRKLAPDEPRPKREYLRRDGAP